jgi:hypothetical protein
MSTINVSFNNFVKSPEIQTAFFVNGSLACMQALKHYSKSSQSDWKKAAIDVGIPALGALATLGYSTVVSTKPNSYFDLFKLAVVMITPLAAPIFSIDNIWNVTERIFGKGY